MPRQIPQPGGTFLGGAGRGRRRGARPAHEGSSCGEAGAWFLRRDSPLSLSS